MAFELTDDGTMDTVLRCSECGEEMRYNYDGGMDAGSDENQSEREQDALDAYDAFVEWAIEDATADHECPLDPDAEPSEPSEDDLTTSDDRTFYQYGKVVLHRAGNIRGDNPDDWYIHEASRIVLLGTFADRDDALRAYMDRVQFWPNAWSISDHGNAHLIDLSRKDD